MMAPHPCGQKFKVHSPGRRRRARQADWRPTRFQGASTAQVLLPDRSDSAAAPDDPDPLMCRLDFLLVFEDCATAEAHLEILEAAAAPDAACELMIQRVSGITPGITSGWKIIGLAPDYTYKVRHQVAALNAAVYRLDMTVTPSHPPSGLEA